MSNTSKRVVEVRLIVIVHLDVTNDEFVQALAAEGKSVAQVVASEVVSNLESVSYVLSAIASPL